MITRILWIVSLLCAVSAQQQSAPTTWDYIFTATVQDSGKFMGAKCDSMKQKCVKYKDEVCRFIERPLQNSGMFKYSCTVELKSDRSKDNKIEVGVTLGLLVDNTKLTFSKDYSTFGAVLKQSLLYLHNTPDANVTITGLPTPTNKPTTPTKPVVIDVIGKLYRDNKPVETSATLEETERCEFEKRLFNLDLGSDLLNVMYKYSPKAVSSQVKIEPTDNTVTFQLTYPAAFFENTGIDFKNDFAAKIKWGFEKLTNQKNYYLGGISKFEATESTQQNSGETKKTIPFTFTASVRDDGILYGKTCGGPKENCTEYKQRLCQLAQKPLACGHVPTSWESCSVDVLSGKQGDEPLKANITLRVEKVPNNMYPITYAPLDSCPTFAGMYKLAFASQSQNPKLDITEFTPTLKPVAITTEEVDIQIRGTLGHKGEEVKPENWKSKAEEKVKSDLLALSLPEEMLNTFYHLPSRKLKELKVEVIDGKVIATLTISYPKAVFEENAIDPGCDLNGMLQWGFQKAGTKKGYSFYDKNNDIFVQNSAAIERPVSFTFTATVTDNGNFQGAECSGQSGQCVKYKEKLCAFVRKPFTTSEIASEDGCVIQILSDRTPDKNELQVKISLQLNMHASKVPFDVHCPTFGGALKQVFLKLYNTPAAALEITEIETLSKPTEPLGGPVGLKVTGSLFRNGKLVNVDGWDGKNDCEVIKQLRNLDMGEDLLNVMYKYNQDNFYLPELTFDEQGKAVFKLIFKKTFFEETKITPDCNFIDTLKWGFQHAVAKEQFYLGNDIDVQLDTGSVQEPTTEVPPALTYTALVDRNLNGYECEGQGYACAAYENELFQIIREPLLCHRVPNEPGHFKIEKVERNEDTGKLSFTFKLNVRTEKDGFIPPIIGEDTSETFRALHNLAFTTFYEQPPVDIQIKEWTPKGAATPEKTVDFKVTGTLKDKNKQTAKSVPDLFEFNYQLANLEMPGKLLQAVYKYNKARTFTPVEPKEETLTNGKVEFIIGFPETFLAKNGIDPTFDLEDMLKWGFGQSSILDEYRLEVTDVTEL